MSPSGINEALGAMRVHCSTEDLSSMNRRKVWVRWPWPQSAGVPQAFGADKEIDDWVGWWERSRKYILQIAEAMPESGYDFRPFQGAGEAADRIRSGDGARSFGELMQHIGQAEGNTSVGSVKEPRPWPLAKIPAKTPQSSI